MRGGLAVGVESGRLLRGQQQPSLRRAKARKQGLFLLGGWVKIARSLWSDSTRSRVDERCASLARAAEAWTAIE
jgi:hypothetical protein